MELVTCDDKEVAFSRHFLHVLGSLAVFPVHHAVTRDDAPSFVRRQLVPLDPQ